MGLARPFIEPRDGGRDTDLLSDNGEVRNGEDM